MITRENYSEPVMLRDTGFDPATGEVTEAFAPPTPGTPELSPSGIDYNFQDSIVFNSPTIDTTGATNFWNPSTAASDSAIQTIENQGAIKTINNLFTSPGEELLGKMDAFSAYVSENYGPLGISVTRDDLSLAFGIGVNGGVYNYSSKTAEASANRVTQNLIKNGVSSEDALSFTNELNNFVDSLGLTDRDAANKEGVFAKFEGEDWVALGLGVTSVLMSLYNNRQQLKLYKDERDYEREQREIDRDESNRRFQMQFAESQRQFNTSQAEGAGGAGVSRGTGATFI